MRNINICNRRNPENELCVLEYNHDENCVYVKPRTNDTIELMINSRNRVTEKLQEERDKNERLRAILIEIMTAHNIEQTSKEKRTPRSFYGSGVEIITQSKGFELRKQADQEDRKDAAILIARNVLKETQ